MLEGGPGLWFCSVEPGLWGMAEEGPTQRHWWGTAERAWSLGVRQQTQLSVTGLVGCYGPSLGNQVPICKMGILYLLELCARRCLIR